MITTMIIFIILVPNVYGITSQTSYWVIMDYPEAVKMQYITSFPAGSSMACIVYCSSQDYPPMMAIQDGYCYCLTSEPQSDILNTLDVRTMFFRSTDRLGCVNKGYNIYPDLEICIKFVHTSMGWNEAKQHCYEDGGYLFNINSDEKLNASLDIAVTYNEYMIGGYAANTDRDFQWTRGGVIRPTYWRNGEPNNANAGEYCMSLRLPEGMNDFDCEFSGIPFVCELLL